MMFTLIEAVVIKDNPTNAARILGAMLDTCVSKLEAMHTVYEELINRIENAKNGANDDPEISLIEKSRPIAFATYAVDKPEDVIQGESDWSQSSYI
jgi:transformation/transcription domain-associated protein